MNTEVDIYSGVDMLYEHGHGTGRVSFDAVCPISERRFVSHRSKFVDRIMSP